jgi:hypothetical protein
VAAVLNGEDFPFEEWISNAAERKDKAKYAIGLASLGSSNVMIDRYAALLKIMLKQ